jgi:molecular chaperone GrpE
MQSSRATESPASTPEPAPTPAPEPSNQTQDDALRAELAQIEDRYTQMEDRYKRALADLENYRKRSERETDRRVLEARETVLRDWLEALDSVERALQMQPEDPGLQAVLVQMEAILARAGVTRVSAAGEPFDPELHQAVAVRSSDEVPDKTIVEVARSGFALGEKVLRPAHVVVSRRPSDG